MEVKQRRVWLLAEDMRWLGQQPVPVCGTATAHQPKYLEVLRELVTSSEVIPVAVMCGKLLASELDLWIYSRAQNAAQQLLRFFSSS